MYNNLIGNDFKQAIEQDDSIVLIDVRTEGEFKGGHIPNAQLINMFSPDFQQRIQGLDKNKKYLIYCRSGARSAHTCSMMTHMGFKDLSNLYGGLFDWNGKIVTLV
jgi:rhodanese-related sulfurtransferase